MKKRHYGYWLLGFVALLGICALAYQPLTDRCCLAEYRRFTSPDGRHVVVVYSRPQWFAMPGSAGDATGVVQLQNAQGQVLQHQPTAMVQTIETVSWERGQVHIKLFADWPLPASTEAL